MRKTGLNSEKVMDLSQGITHFISCIEDAWAFPSAQKEAASAGESHPSLVQSPCATLQSLLKEYK